MRNIVYIIILSLFSLTWASCGGSGEDDEFAPEPETPAPPAAEKEPKLSFALKSDIAGVQDATLKTMLSHVRLYVFDKDQKLKSETKATSADGLKSLELASGTYTVVLVGNVPNDSNIVNGGVGSVLKDMSVQLLKRKGAANYSPLGDVLFAKGTIAVGKADTSLTLSVKRTLASTTVGMTDYSGKIAEVGVLIPGVGTEMSFSDVKWTKPGVVFVPMSRLTGKALSKAETEEPRSYSASMNIAVVTESGEPEETVQCNIVATDENQETVVAQVVEVPAETKPNAEVTLDVEVKASASETGAVEVAVSEVEVKKEDGTSVEVKKEEVVQKDSEVDFELLPGDWEYVGDIPGDDEYNATIGTPEDFVTPGGSKQDWSSTNQENVSVRDSVGYVIPGGAKQDWSSTTQERVPIDSVHLKK